VVKQRLAPAIGTLLLPCVDNAIRLRLSRTTLTTNAGWTITQLLTGFSQTVTSRTTVPALDVERGTIDRVLGVFTMWTLTAQSTGPGWATLRL
jgi:hypothetical protein